jgi:hypothetical protein
MIRNKVTFYGEELSTPLPTPNLEDYPLSDVCDCLFNIFLATLHIGGRSSIRNLRTLHAVVTGTDLSRRKIHNGELHDLYCSPNIVRVMKLRRKEMGGACSAYGGEERRLQGFGGET